MTAKVLKGAGQFFITSDMISFNALALELDI